MKAYNRELQLTLDAATHLEARITRNIIIWGSQFLEQSPHWWQASSLAGSARKAAGAIF